MSDAKPPPTQAEVMPLIANGINNALVSSFGTKIEFLLVVAMPCSDDPDSVELSTITGITDPGWLRSVAHHINDLANQNLAKQNELDPDSDADVAGHA